MIIKIICALVAIFTCIQTHAQLSIDVCYQKARANYPSIRQFDLIKKSTQYNLNSANSGYLPQITLSGKMSYQSEVLELPISLPGFNGVKKDQYSATLDVSQTIWDGGLIKVHKEEIRTRSEVEQKNIEVELYSLNDRINQIYFAILLFDAQLNQNHLYSAELQRNYDKINSLINNGVANKSDLDAVKVEQLKAIQTRSTLAHSKTAYVAMLSALIGEKLPESIKLIYPTEIVDLEMTNRRPELELYNAKIKNLEVGNKQIKSDMMPKFGAFVSGGYGRPGLDMLKSSFSPYYVAGVRLSWNINNFYNIKSNRQLVKNHIAAVETQQNTFLFNSDIDISTKQSAIAKYRDQLQYDDQIIELKESIKKSAESKVLNGTISVIDLMRDVTAENMAKQNKIFHQIELLQAIYNLKYVINNF